MIFEIEAGGRLRAVAVERLGAAGPEGGRFRILIDGVPAHEDVVDVRHSDLGLSLVFDADGRSIDVAATERPGGDWLIQLPHVDVPVVVDGRRSARGPKAGAARAGEQRVTAPMPGRVLRVLVKAGDVVSARQGLVVVEAMKMENELGSPKAGRVKEVAVSEGASVEAGRLLIVIE